MALNFKALARSLKRPDLSATSEAKPKAIAARKSAERPSISKSHVEVSFAHLRSLSDDDIAALQGICSGASNTNT